MSLKPHYEKINFFYMNYELIASVTLANFSGGAQLAPIDFGEIWTKGKGSIIAYLAGWQKWTDRLLVLESL